MGWMPLAGAGRTIHCSDPHLCQQGTHSLMPDGTALLPEQIAQHPSTGKPLPQMELVDPAHRRQIRIRNRLWLIVGRGTGHRQDFAWAYDWQFVGSVDHPFALSHPALVSARSKKSFSSANWPILVWRVLRSGVSDVGFVPRKTSAARTSNCGF